MTQYTSYEDYRKAIDEQIAKSLETVQFKLANLPIITPLLQQWKATINDNLEKSLNITAATDQIVRVPKNAPVEWGPDYALPMYQYAKMHRTSPVALASQAASVVESSHEFKKVEAAGPYVNFRLNDEDLFKNITEIISAKENYGKLNDYKGKVAIVDYSSPNVAKPFGINHLRSTVIGESLARITEASGYVVVRDNHLGDWGTQFGNLLAAHQEYMPERDFASLTMDELTEIYVRFSNEKKESPRLVRLGQTCFAQLEAGNPDLRSKWASALQLSIDEFSKMYKRLNVHFDTIIGEGYFVDASNKLLADLKESVASGLVVFADDSKTVYINAEHPVILRTQDGYGVYSARDLATIQFRQKTYNPDLVLYVVGEEQSSYFRSVFEVADKEGLTALPNGNKMNLDYVGFGLLLDEYGKKLSTRKGTSGKLEDVLNALDERAYEETALRNADLNNEQLQDISKKVALAALIWNDLRTDRESNIRFDIKKMLELGSGSVVDILYTYSRTCSILDKIAVDDATPLVDDFPNAFSTEVEHQLSVRLCEFEDIIRKSANDRAPHNIVMYLQELSLLHGRFYEESRVVGLDDVQLTNLRIAIHRAYKIVVHNGLTLLNIPVLQRM